MTLPSATPDTPSTTVSLDGARLSYEVTGHGRPVVLVHGLGASTVIWADVRGPLERTMLVVAADLRGSGRTSESSPGELSLERWARDLRAVVETAGLERPALVGHSLGASVAIKYALAWPEDVSALVLMGADAHLAQLAPRMERTVELIGKLGLQAWVDDYWSNNPPFSSASLARAPELFARYREMLLANDPASYVRTCLAIAGSEDQTGRLAEVRQPTLVLAGSDDDRTRPEASRALAASLPNATLVELAGVGHTLPFEAPEEVAAAVIDFLERT